MSTSVSADKVVGNRLRVKNDTPLILGFVGSGETEIIKAGRLTPPVYSWVTDNGTVYWVLNELGRNRLLKHESENLEIVADSGGAKYLEDSTEGGVTFSGVTQAVGDALDLFTPKNLRRALIAGGLLVAGYIGLKTYDIFN